MTKPIEEKSKTTIPQPVPEPIKSTSSISNGKYHVIGGSFSVESNANKFVSQMISKGFDAKSLGKINQMYIVSVGNYATQRQALSDRKVKHLKGWIYREN